SPSFTQRRRRVNEPAHTAPEPLDHKAFARYPLNFTRSARLGMNETPQPAGVTIVAIDDDPTTVRLLQKHVTDAGHRFIAVDFSQVSGDIGDHVVSVVKSNGAHIVVCDLNLPGSDKVSSVTNGLGILRKLSASTGAYVIAISGAIDEGALNQLKAFKVKRGF